MCQGCVQDGSISRAVYKLIEMYNKHDPEAQCRGGHIVFADCNVRDSDLDYCLEQTKVPLTDGDRDMLRVIRALPINMRIPNKECR